MKHLASNTFTKWSGQLLCLPVLDMSSFILIAVPWWGTAHSTLVSRAGSGLKLCHPRKGPSPQKKLLIKLKSSICLDSNFSDLKRIQADPRLS